MRPARGDTLLNVDEIRYARIGRAVGDVELRVAPDAVERGACRQFRNVAHYPVVAHADVECHAIIDRPVVLRVPPAERMRPPEADGSLNVAV